MKGKKYAIKILLSLFLITLLSTCKKYDEGGLLRLNRKHLFGEKKNFASKTWKLEKYEVNGIDSTYLIPGANQIPNFYENFITFTLDNKEGHTYTANTYLFSYSGYVNFASSKEIGLYNSDPNINNQCKKAPSFDRAFNPFYFLNYFPKAVFKFSSNAVKNSSVYK